MIESTNVLGGCASYGAGQFFQEKGPLLDALQLVDVTGIGLTVRGAIQVEELYRMQNRVCQVLIEKLDYRVIALEASPEIGQQLNAYIQGGTVAVANILHAAWKPWRTAAFRDFLEWLRNFNKTQPSGKVTIRGIDTNAVSPDPEFANGILNAYREKRQKMLYLGGAAHVTKGLVYRNPFRQEPLTAKGQSISAGYLLAKELGERYFAIAISVGTVPDLMAPPAADFTEARLPAGQHETQWLYLGSDKAREKTPLLFQKPFKLRSIGPQYDRREDAQYYLRGDSLNESFDALILVPMGTLATGLTV